MEHAGHRKRLIEKLEQEALREHEVLEVLLFNAVPRKNTNDIAHRLLAEFGSVPAILEAPISALKAVDGVGDSLAAYLRCIGAFAERYYAAYKDRFPFAFEEEEFLSYVRREYTYLDTEVLDCFLLNHRGRILQRKRFSVNAQDFSSIEPEELTELLTSRGVCGVVFVHNHPNASSAPSACDDDMTKKCQWICTFHNVLLCEHVICGEEGIYSYYREGKLLASSQTSSILQMLREGNYGKK